MISWPMVISEFKTDYKLNFGRTLGSFWEVVKISRDQNNVMHELARFATRSRECQCFFACFPEWVVSLSCKDVT